MHSPRQFRLIPALVVLLALITDVPALSNVTVSRPSWSAVYPSAPADTTGPRQKLSPANPAFRQATKPMILPGTRLDPRLRNIPAQDPAVAKAVPAWLRAKAKGTPMYMIDGHGATAAQLRPLQQKQVASVNVLDGTKAAKLYGPNARNGMVIITTRAGVEPKK